jgi:hypothetical protein
MGGAGETLTFAYADRDGDGQADDLTSVTGIDGDTATVNYVGGDVTSVTGVAGAVETLTQSSGKLTLIADGVGTKSFSYLSQLLTSSDDGAKKLNYSWNAAGNLIGRGFGTQPIIPVTPAIQNGLTDVYRGTPRGAIDDGMGAISPFSNARHDLMNFTSVVRGGHPFSVHHSSSVSNWNLEQQRNKSEWPRPSNLSS